MSQHSAPFHMFADNTKQTCGIITLSLFIILILLVTPFNAGRMYIIISKILVIIMLLYTFLRNFKETNRLVKNIPEIFSNQQFSSIKNNMLLSYILTISIMVLIIYIVYTIIF